MAIVTLDQFQVLLPSFRIVRDQCKVHTSVNPTPYRLSRDPHASAPLTIASRRLEIYLLRHRLIDGALVSMKALNPGLLVMDDMCTVVLHGPFPPRFTFVLQFA